MNLFGYYKIVLFSFRPPGGEGNAGERPERRGEGFHSPRVFQNNLELELCGKTPSFTGHRLGLHVSGGFYLQSTQRRGLRIWAIYSVKPMYSDAVENHTPLLFGS